MKGSIHEHAKPRKSNFQILDGFDKFSVEGYHFTRLIYPKTTIPILSEIQDGAQVMAGCVIQTDAVR